MIGWGAGFGGRRKAPVDTEINLIPVMNLFVVLIPFLLLGVSFYQIAAIPGTVPTHDASGGSDVASTSRAVTLTLGVSHENGFLVRASGTGVTREALQALAVQIPRKDEIFDTGALSRVLLEIKRAYPDSDTVVLVPEGDVLFSDLVKTMDAAREVVVGTDGPVDQRPRLTLFPRVVFSRRLPPPAESTPPVGEASAPSAAGEGS